MFLTTSLNYNNVCTVEVSFDKLFLYYEHTVHYECDYPLLKYIYFCNWRVTVDKNGCMKHSRHMNGRCLSRVSLSFSLIVRTIRQSLQPITATTAAQRHIYCVIDRETTGWARSNGANAVSFVVLKHVLENFNNCWQVQ